MTLRLVNTAPGEDSSPVKPGQYAQFGFKSETMKVVASSVSLQMGLTNVAHHGLLPETDPVLADLGAQVTLETSEHRRPVDGVTPVTLSSGNLVLTKTTSADGELGIYEVSFPIEDRASCLASFRFKKKTWTPTSVDWCSLTNMVGMYFGLEHGTFNTAAYTFLRANTPQGSLVIGGPLQSYSTARPGQVEVLPGSPHGSTPGFQWRTLAADSVIELHIFFNVEGYESPPASGVPTNTPLVEIWTKLPTDPGPVVQAYLPVGSLGTFPSSTASVPFTNSRAGVSKTATIFFGNIGTSGDVLELTDWAFFPDYRIAVWSGSARPNHDFKEFPDSPSEFRASNNKLPFDLETGRWFADTSSGWLAPSASLFFQPGRRGEALHVSLAKSQPGLSGIRRDEPRLEERIDGVMLEAFISGEVTSPSGDGTGMGFSIDDGLKSYQVLMVKNPFREFYGVVKDLANLDTIATGYYAPAGDKALDSPKLVRLVVDRLRPAAIGGKVDLFVDEELVSSSELSDPFPSAPSAAGRIRFGHLGLPNAVGSLNISKITYLQRYLAWEGVDALTPDDVGMDARVKFVTESAGAATVTFAGSKLVMTKTSAGGGSKLLFRKDQDFSEVEGMMVDFSVGIDSYADLGGASFAPNMATGVTLTIYLGNKKVQVGFYDCGPYGRRIGILPSNGLPDDILQQTLVGRERSAPHDWTVETQIRLIVKGKDRIELVIGSPISPPSIIIPWRNDTEGFDLPVDVSTPRIVFGHSGGDTTSTSRWGFVRWGLSDGFEVAVQQKYPNGYPKYLFGGRAFIKSEFEEAP